jgi:DNA (cytosine-5)-methyltransferase 1
MSRSTTLTFVDLFAGCGGFSLGLFEAGWTGLFAVEKDPMAFSTLKANFLSTQSRHQFQWPKELPKQSMDIMEVLGDYKSQLRKVKVDLVCGGPPCQGFSYSGQRKL